MFVNNRWCNPRHVTVKERFCSPDIKLLAVSLRPYYLPREFTCAIIVAVYISPSADADAACDNIHSVTAGLKTQHLNAFIAIYGDVSFCYSPNFPAVCCPTRDNKTLDLLYANVKDSYSSTALPPLGRSDHNLVLLTSTYTPIVQKQPVTTRIVRRWSKEADGLCRGALNPQTGMYSVIPTEMT